MIVLPWLSDHWYEALESAGIIGGLLFTGFAVRTDARVRRAQTRIELTRAHREIWDKILSDPETALLLESDRDVSARPITAKEIEVVNRLVLHLRGALGAAEADIYIKPERLDDDVRDFFAHPIPRAAWRIVRESHDAEFVAYIDALVIGDVR